MGFEPKIDGTLRQLQNEIYAEYASVPLGQRDKLNINLSLFFSSINYANPYAAVQLGTMLNNIRNQKTTLTSNNEFKDNALARRQDAEEKWEEQVALCYQLSTQLGGIDKDKNPDEYAAIQKDLNEAEFWRELRGEQMVDAVKFFNGLA